MENILSEAMARLDIICQKLGVASGQLWAVLIRQAVVEGYLYLIQGIIALLFAGFCAWNIKRGLEDLDDAVNMIRFLVGLMFGLISGVLAITLFSDAITYLVNPGYGALEILKSLLKGIV